MCIDLDTTVPSEEAGLFPQGDAMPSSRVFGKPKTCVVPRIPVIGPRITEPDDEANGHERVEKNSPLLSGLLMALKRRRSEED